MLLPTRVGAAASAVVLAFTLVLGLLAAAPTAAQAAPNAPTGLSVASYSSNAVRLRWTPVDGAAAYRIRYATNSKFTHSKSVRSTAPQVEIGSLKASKTYYFKVRALRVDGAALTSYGRTTKVRTRSKKSYVALSPTGLVLSPVNATDLTASWTAARKASRYKVAVSANGFKTTTYVTTMATTVKVKGLIGNTSYAVKVRAVTSSGKAAGQYSDVVRTTTPLREAPLRVATYNIHCHNCSPASADPTADEQPWTLRRTHVAAAITEADPDVVALQEAQQSWLDDSPKGGLSQFEDLVARLGSPWTLANPHRNNCVKSTTPTDCVYADQGASSGTKIIFREDRLQLLSEGSKKLTPLSTTSKARYVAWAFLQQRSTGKKFLLADIHLEPGNDSNSASVRDSWCGTSANPICTLNRQVQARDVLAKITALNTEDLPVVLAGDAASSRAEVGGNLPYAVLTAKLVDPLGGTSYKAPAIAPAQTRTNIAFASVNKYERVARRYAPSSETTYNAASTNLYNGAYNDYILVSPSFEIAEFEQVVDVDAYGRFVGVIPSDHNMLRATLWLP